MSSVKSIVNKKAKLRYEIIETIEAGIELKGSEVKSVREGRVSIDEAFALIKNGEVYLYNMHIAPYTKTGSAAMGHDPVRPRRLLLHKREIKRLLGKTTQRGLTLIPLRLYFNSRGWLKVELALAKGKTKVDRREELKRRTLEREMRAYLKRF